MKMLFGVMVALTLPFLSLACGGDDKPSPAATSASPVTGAVASTAAPSSGTPNAIPPLPTATPASGVNLTELFSARSVWPQRPGTDDLWKQVCGVSPYQLKVGDPCVYTVMQRGGASPESIDFVRRYGYFLSEFQEKGNIDYGLGSAPWLNMGRPLYHLALNGFPALQELGDLIPANWKTDPRYADALRREPQTFPWPEYGGLDATRPGNDGSTIWTTSFRLAPCRACPDTAFISMDVEWDRNGFLDRVTLLPPRSGR